MSLSQSVKVLFFKPKSLLIISLVSFLYFSFSVLILNYRLFLITLLNENPLGYKLTVVYQLILGSYSAFNRMDFYALVLISILVGLNVLATVKIIKALRSDGGKFSIVFGGGTVLGVLVTGCSSCGFSVISILGFTSALSIIPLGQFGFSLIVILLLFISLFYSLKTYHSKIICRIPLK